ncbi:MAG: hypothetical protein K0Q53_350 [Massilibacillus sp.]|jgi:hypothetical protein|nr:hypothetical protein [Massilibacillus sp.]
MASRKILIASILVLAVIAFAGYLFKATVGDSKNPKGSTAVATQTDIGIIDMNKALKAHPKYQDLVRLKKELNSLTAQNEAAQNFTIDNQAPLVNQGSLDDAMQQKQNEKLIAKHAEISERLKRKNKELTDQFGKEFEAEVATINTYYQPILFDLKLKAETANITEEARKELNNKRMNLESERNQKIAQKQQEFNNKLNTIMQDETKKGEIELAEERKQIEEEAKTERNVKQEEIDTRNNQAMTNQNEAIKLDINQVTKGKETIIYKEQEIAVLEESMNNDIASKVAKIAIEKNLATVLAVVQVNVNAIDITDLVIAEFKK